MWFTATAIGQTTSNVDFRQEGDNMLVSYKLSAQADIALLISIDGGIWQPLESVTGDVGKAIKPGLRKIVWDVFEDYPDGIHADVEFIVAPNLSTPSISQIPENLNASSPIISNYKAYWAKKSDYSSRYAGDVRRGTFASATDRWSFTLNVYCYDFLKKESSVVYTKSYSGTSMRKKPFGEYRSYFRDEPQPACNLSINDNGQICIDKSPITR